MAENNWAKSYAFSAMDNNRYAEKVNMFQFINISRFDVESTQLKPKVLYLRFQKTIKTVTPHDLSTVLQDFPCRFNYSWFISLLLFLLETRSRTVYRWILIKIPKKTQVEILITL